MNPVRFLAVLTLGAIGLAHGHVDDNKISDSSSARGGTDGHTVRRDQLPPTFNHRPVDAGDKWDLCGDTMFITGFTNVTMPAVDCALFAAEMYANPGFFTAGGSGAEYNVEGLYDEKLQSLWAYGDCAFAVVRSDKNTTNPTSIGNMDMGDLIKEVVERSVESNNSTATVPQTSGYGMLCKDGPLDWILTSVVSS